MRPRHLHKLNSTTVTNTITVYTHDPLPIDGRAIVLMFFSSAKVRTFLTAFSKLSTEESLPHVGLWTWITYCAGKLCPSEIAAMREAKKMISLLTLCGNFSSPADINISNLIEPQVCQVGPHAQFNWQSDIFRLSAYFPTSGKGKLWSLKQWRP